MAERTVTIPPGVGLHARPAALFVQAASRADTRVTIGRAGAEPVDAASILSVMGLGVGPGEEVVLSADGDGADRVLDELAAVLTAAEHG